jgi:dephospho-CoA kinase
MILVGLTGGIGSGKSTVSELLAAKGAVIVDADAIVREVQEPGRPVLAAIAERFGPGVLTADGALDRAGLAALVFNDGDALRALNGIVHPAVRAEMRRQVNEHRDTDRVVVMDVPLMVEGGRRRYNTAGVVVVDVPVDVAVDRLVRFRAFAEADARARIGRQVSREERLAAADRVIDNSGDRETLAAQIEELWAWILTLPPAPDEDPAPEPEAHPDPATKSNG